VRDVSLSLLLASVDVDKGLAVRVEYLETAGYLLNLPGRIEPRRGRVARAVRF
jgi:hypothetical protein